MQTFDADTYSISTLELHCMISLVACYTKLSSPFVMANGVLISKIADSHQQ